MNTISLTEYFTLVGAERLLQYKIRQIEPKTIQLMHQVPASHIVTSDKAHAVI